MVSRMVKADLVKCLQDCGVAVDPRWTVEELRTILKTNTNNAGTTKELAMTSMKRADLVEFAEGLGITVGKNDTRGDIMVRIRAAVRAQNPPKGNDMILFGKCQGQTYAECLANNRDYCTWVTTTAEERGDEAHPELRRFALFINNSKAPKTNTEQEAEFADEPDPVWVMPEVKIKNESTTKSGTNPVGTRAAETGGGPASSGAASSSGSDRMSRLEWQVENLTALLTQSIMSQQEEKMEKGMTDSSKRRAAPTSS